MARAIKITSVSGALTVTITGPNGGTPVVYADSSFVNVQTMPATIADTATTTFWLQGPGRYTLSVKTSGGTEIAADNNSTRTVDLETDGTVAALNYDARTLATVSGDSGHSTAGSAASGTTQITASGDTTGATDGPAINAAITTAFAAGGGIVEIIGACWTNVKIVPKAGVWLRGLGWTKSSINLATGANIPVIQPGSTYYQAKITDLTIDGWKENQGAGAWYGIDFSLVASRGGAASNVYIGGQGIYVERVLVRSTKSTGYYIDVNGSVEARLTDCYLYGADGDGYFVTGSDTFVLNCTSGGTLGHGFNVPASGARLNNCKAWQAGWSWSRTFTSSYPSGGDTTKNGYHVTGQNCTLVACEAQDNAGVGLNMGGDTCQAFGFNADANLTAAYQLYINARHCEIHGIIGNGTSHGTPSTNALGIFDSSAAGNRVRLSWPNNSGGVSAGMSSGSRAKVPGNDIVIGTPDAQLPMGFQSTVTPDPFFGSPFMQLSGNVTIANPAADRYIPGTKVRVTFVQDGTGSRTVTWGADYNVLTAIAATLSQATTWTFECMNGKWVEVSAKAGLTGVTVPNTAPGQVGTVTPTGASGQVALAWSAPNNGGSAITDYIVQYRTTTGPGAWTTFPDGTSASTGATVTGLTNGTSYDFQVAAVNAIGQGAYSSPVTLTAGPSTYASDAFTGANSNTSLNGRTSDTGQVWSVVTAGASMGITTNQAFSFSAGSREIAVVDAGVADCVIYLDLPTVGGNANFSGGIAFRASDDSNKWMVRRNILEKMVAGSVTSPASWTALVAGDTLKVVLSGSTINVYKITSGVTTLIGGPITDSFNSTVTKQGVHAHFSSDPMDNFFVKVS